MKLSEHIKECQDALAQHGDLNVEYTDLSDEPERHPLPSVDLIEDEKTPPRFDKFFSIGLKV